MTTGRINQVTTVGLRRTEPPKPLDSRRQDREPTSLRTETSLELPCKSSHTRSEPRRRRIGRDRPPSLVDPTSRRAHHRTKRYTLDVQRHNHSKKKKHRSSHSAQDPELVRTRQSSSRHPLCQTSQAMQPVPRDSEHPNRTSGRQPSVARLQSDDCPPT